MLESDYQKEKGSGDSVESAYTVEARSPMRAQAVGSLVLGETWHEIDLHKVQAGLGVPNPDRLTIHGLLDYATAQGVRWWFIADLKQKLIYGVETRLVRHKLTTSYKIEAIEDVDHKKL